MKDVGLVVAVVIFLALLPWEKWSNEGKENEIKTYRAWRGLTGKTNLSLSEWKLLKNQKLLQGQQESETVFVPLVISH